MQNPVPFPNVYSVEEFAKMFKLSAEVVRKLIRQGEIPAIRIGKQYRIPQHVIDRYLAQALPPEERGFGMWGSRPVKTLAYLNRLRGQDRRSPEAFLKEMIKDP